ncbi:peptidase C11 clostripain, partial [filamentous cyanobacterium Phorm 6]
MPNLNGQFSGSAIAFIDSQVEDYQSLIAGVTPGTEVVVLDGNRDAIEQITEVLDDRSNIDSIHIISHGAPGSLQLGKTRLCSDNLETYSKQFQQWGSALNLGADILIYGCNVALTSFTFIQRIAQLTNTNVAASKNLTGSAAKGGDWELEVTTGKIAASLAFRPEVLAAYSHVLSTFSEARNYGVTHARDMDTGDLNGDGFLDLVVVGNTTYDFKKDIVILLGTGTTGSFGTPISLFQQDKENPTGVVVRDFNGDGKLDLATANFGFSNNGYFVSIRLGTGTGSFGNPTNFGQDINHSSIAAGDFNGDGKLDLATVPLAGNNISTISILFGDGTGSFGTDVKKINTQKPKSTVATADFNGDGKLDLVTSNNQNTDNISVFLGDGNGNFNSPVNLTSGAGSVSQTVVTGDFNGDGKLDLAANNSNDKDVSVFLGDGTGNFGNATKFTVANRPLSVLPGDFNGDGKLDLATTGEGKEVSVLLGDGTGNFGNLSNFTIPIFGRSDVSMAARDFNGDGKLDIATAFAKNVSILLNTSNTVNFGAATYKGVEGTTDKVVDIAVKITGGTPLNDVVVPIVLDPTSTATQNSDYTFSPTSITFPAGATGAALTKNIAFTIKSDSISENPETAIFNFGTITGAIAGPTKTTTLTISDQVSVAYDVAAGTASIDEGNSGKKPLTFTVTRSNVTNGASSVKYAIAGTATNGSDYNNIGGTSGARTTAGTINFATGETSKTITLDVLGDTTVEPDETIAVTLSNPTGIAAATPVITTDTATTTIINYTVP